MACNLRWLASASASCFHAVAALAAGRQLVDADLAAALAEPVAKLLKLDLPQDTFLNHLVPLAAGIESNRELASVTLTKTIGQGNRAASLQASLLQAISAAEDAMMRTVPNVVEELALRGPLLRQQWEARGPGMMGVVAQLTSSHLIVPQADVILVHPALGGAGTAHLPYNSVRIEAVLANPLTELPEVVRLAWLLAQLNNDLPIYSERIPGARLQLVSGLAMLPVVLAAAQRVDLAKHDDATVRLALDAWGISAAGEIDLVEVVGQWWDTHLASRPDWTISLTALDHMLTTRK